MAIKIGHASISENGTIRGTAGDQNGREVFTRNWYRHSKGWVTLRCKVPEMREYIARAMEKACANPDIGYDQIENQTLYNNVKPYGFDPSRTTKAVETDCARLVRVCCQYACEMVGNGKTIPDFYTASLANALVKTGLFEKLTASKYNDQDAYLLRGDIQVTRTKGHTWIILENGSKSGAENKPAEPEKEYELGERILRNGMSGEDVKEMQEYLNQIGYDCGSADGEFGDNTEIGLKEFQTAYDLEVDGEYGPKSHAALMAALEDAPAANPRTVKIVNGNCYVRKAPNKDSNPPLGVARKGESYKFGGVTSEDGWRLIEYKGQNGWVSGKYSMLED